MGNLNGWRQNWKSTGIKATGEKGDRGDAVFAENGVDYTSDPDNVIFTLADGKTKLTVPRTKNIICQVQGWLRYFLGNFR